MMCFSSSRMVVPFPAPQYCSRPWRLVSGTSLPRSNSMKPMIMKYIVFFMSFFSFSNLDAFQSSSARSRISRSRGMDRGLSCFQKMSVLCFIPRTSHSRQRWLVDYCVVLQKYSLISKMGGLERVVTLIDKAVRDIWLPNPRTTDIVDLWCCIMGSTCLGSCLGSPSESEHLGKSSMHYCTGVSVGHLPCATTLHVLRRSIRGANNEIISTMMLIEDVLSDAMAVKKPSSTILAEQVLITLITGLHHRS